jgi:aminoglycoside/choline kinase family phosphotransferase
VFDADRQRQEMALYRDWYVNNRAQLGKAPETPYALTEADEKILTDTFEKLIAHNQQWPNVYVHSDFMPRNLMVSSEKMGVLDFQDAVYGPITYDIASLMRDAFWSCEEEEVLDVTIRYWSKARKAGLPVGDDFGAFYQAVEWMSLQRHLRIVGTFARLSLRDGKPRYAEDIPRFIDYIRSTCSRYMELKPLLRLVERVEGIAVPNMFAFGRT